MMDTSDYGTNLLAETEHELAENDKATEDVLHVCRKDGQEWISWEQFCKLAGELDYDAGYGLQVITLDLKVVGRGWWLERHEYDGSEWWEFKQSDETRGVQVENPGVPWLVQR